MPLIRIIERPDGKRIDINETHITLLMNLVKLMKMRPEVYDNVMGACLQTFCDNSGNKDAEMTMMKVRHIAHILYTTDFNDVETILLNAFRGNTDPIILFFGIMYIVCGLNWETFIEITHRDNRLNRHYVETLAGGKAMKDLYEIFDQVSQCSVSMKR
jgi:hypothetical protein